METVLFEGPLDEKSMARVVQYGQQGEDAPSLYEALQPAAIKEINLLLSTQSGASTTAGSYLEMFRPTRFRSSGGTCTRRPSLDDLFCHLVRLFELETLDGYGSFSHRPETREKNCHILKPSRTNWSRSMESPLSVIVNYLNHFKNWRVHKEVFKKAFLEGDIRQFFSMTGEFPTRCESILAKRDPIFFKGIQASLQEGRTVAFVGVAHIPGIRKLFLEEGYQVTQEES